MWRKRLKRGISILLSQVDETTFMAAGPYLATNEAVEIVARKPVHSSTTDLWMLVYG